MSEAILTDRIPLDEYAGLLGDAFVHRVLQEVKSMEMTCPPPVHVPHVPAAWHAASWKIAAGLLVVGALAGFHFLPTVLAPQATASLAASTRPTLPVV